ncbi:cysteine proteinase inhibitor 12 [Selaginella moellendorffii]|uniref:cysteine proteinase inhibitor 12 n=1 Tax=Selaginella moellendorffii TaxID=88036 RepID=UPI000D1C9962|nr:cysteine proteinase inhibitor 12 [Selaginella moellendorffii]|eukprot:XP_024538739.1 cysteine proteinase inhibitor 12 [Selaginella moellendorffii]
MTTLVGAPKPLKEANSLEAEEHAKFAVEEHNRQNPEANLCFKRVVSAQTQVVSGTMFHLSIEAHSEQHGTGVYDAKVWTKPWESFKKLEEFKPSKQETAGAAIALDDPVVINEAAEHALKGLQQRSNSLIPYELDHVVKAQAEEGTNALDLVLKVKRGSREEHVNAKLHRGDTGWTLTSAHVL